jgi:hypothetical protein
MKKAQALLAASLMAPVVALAFETVDTLPWPSAGRFPAYPREEVRPTDLWLQGGVMRDDNLLRLDAGAQADTVTRWGGGFRHAQRVIGRQRLLVEARADYYAFNEFDQLDHLAYSGLADWRWEIGNELSGSIALGRERRLVDLSETLASARSMVTVTSLSGTGGYLITPSLRLRGGLSTVAAERTLRDDADTRANAVSAGIDYVSPLRNTLGVEVRVADGNARVAEEVVPGALISNDFDEREVAFVAGYAPGTRLRGDLRLGRTTRKYNDIPSRDFEGSSWRVRGEWLPGNKTILALSVYKEPRSIIDIAASHVIVKGFSFGPSWAATSKLVFSAALLRERRIYEGDPDVFVTGAPVQNELRRAVRFGIGWEPLRHWQVGVALDRGERESNFAGRGYDFTAVSANLAWRY